MPPPLNPQELERNPIMRLHVQRALFTLHALWEARGVIEAFLDAELVDFEAVLGGYLIEDKPIDDDAISNAIVGLVAARDTATAPAPAMLDLVKCCQCGGEGLRAEMESSFCGSLHKECISEHTADCTLCRKLFR